MRNIRNNPRMTAVMPTFSGGLNLHAGQAQIADTELADCENLLYENGQLRTRDGFVPGASARYPYAEHTVESRHFTHRGRVWWWEQTTFTQHGGPYTRFTLYECRQANCEPIERFRHDCYGGVQTGLCVPSGGARRDCRLLVYLSDGSVFGVGDGGAVDLTDEVYRPLCRINGTPTLTRDGAVSGVAVEGRNRLTPQFRLAFTADGEGLYYPLPSDATALSATVGTVTYLRDDSSGEYTLRSERGVCWFERAGVATALPAGAHNAVVITATGEASPFPIYEMRSGCWYGGQGNSPEGTRLFLMGESDTLIYSAADDPLYFPDSCYLRVGSPCEAITALGRQRDDLIVFKQRELYAVGYRQGETVHADAVESGLITDLHAAVAVFPLTLIDDTVGCDLPDTVEVLDGQLIWGCRDRTVYTLCDPTSALPYRIKELNRAVSSDFLPYPRTVSGVTFRSRYYLLWDGALWVYGDGVWFRWSWPQNGATPLAVLATDVLLVLGEDDQRRYLFFQGGDDVTVTGESFPVIGRMRTKSFDFGTPETYKAVTAVAAEAGGRNIRPRYHTERETVTDSIHTPDRGGLLQLTPSLPRLRRFALELEGEGLTVGAVTVTVKGGMR